jgi:hypothetical protein
MDLARGNKLVESMSDYEREYMKSYADVARIDSASLARAIGASVRLCGTDLIDAEAARKVRIPKHIDRMVRSMQGPGAAIIDGDSFVAAYRRLAKAVPKGATLVNVGSSPDKFAFMHELLGNDVVYVSFSRGSLTKKALSAAFHAAGVDLSDANRGIAVVDYVDTGATYRVLLAGLAMAKAPVTAIALHWRGNPKDIPVPSTIKMKYLCFPKEFWWHGKYLSRCVPKNEGGAIVPPFPAQIAMCNLVRLWVAALARKLQQP